MNAYGIFAKYYDVLTQDVDYKSYANNIKKLFELHGLNPTLVLDMACGTGSLSFEFEKLGYEVLGIDSSEQMLSQAYFKAQKKKSKVMFIKQDMTELDLYGTVDAVICSLDGINHLTSPQKVIDVFKRVALFLNPNGLFVFDVNTEYKFEKVIGNNTFIYDCDEVYCIWQNSYNPKSKLCGFELTFFEKTGEKYERYDEHLCERAYSEKNILKYLRKAGFESADIYDENTLIEPGSESLRHIYVAGKK